MSTRTLIIPLAWRHLVGGIKAARLEGETAGEMLQRLTVQFPALQTYVFDGPELNEIVNVFVGDMEIRHLQGFATALPPGVPVRILVAISGGD